MRKAGLVLILVAVAVAAFLLLRSSGSKPVVGDGTEEGAAPAARGPRPMGPLESTAGGPHPTTPRPEKDGEADGPTGPAADDRLPETLEVLVVDDEGGKPVEKAAVYVTTAGRRPCPPVIDERYFLVDTVAVQTAGHPVDIRMSPSRGGVPAYSTDGVTDGQGRFVTKWTKDPADLVVRKRGWIIAAACSVTPGGTTTVRLRRGLSIEGMVVTPDGKPIATARIDANPQRGVAPTPGHREFALTGEDGAFAVEGLLPGAFDVVVSHPKYVPELLSAVDAGKKGLRITLRPAFLVTFRVTTDNGLAPETPTAGWKMPGTPPWEGLEMLQQPSLERDPHSPVGAPADAMAGDVPVPPDAAPLPTGTFLYEPIRVPAGRPTATFTVKATGTETWASPPVDVPAEGGATTLEVSLRRDPDLGSAKIAFESRDHQPLSFVGERCRLDKIYRRDGKAVDAGVVFTPGETLGLSSIPSGPYRLVILSPLHAPATMDVTVPPSAVAESLATLGPPAKLHIRATAAEATTIRLQIKQGRDPVWFFVENAQAAAPAAGADAPNGAAGQDDAGGNEQTVPAGSDGILLTGLGVGRVTIEVTSTEWTAPPTSVDLVEGDTKEIEIAVTKR